jgi:hypothetical protein
MENVHLFISVEDAQAARQRRLDAQHLQAMEGNPLSADDIAMFEMFERERWSDEACLTYIAERALKPVSTDAAE